MSDTLPGRLAGFAAARPDAVALREKRLGIWREITWAEYWRSVQAAARRLAELGVGPGDAVAILADNRPEWLYADLGAQLLGARSVGVYQTSPAEDVAYVVAHSGAKVLVADDQEQVDKAIAARDATPECAHVVVIEPRGTRDYDDPRLVTWEAFHAAGAAALAGDPDGAWARDRLAALDPASPTMVVYTSGTTGQPKGALLSAGNVLPVAAEMLPLLGVRERDSLLSYLPLCHVAEKIFTLFIPLSAGCTVHFGESIETVREDLREVAPTVFLGVPRIWEKMHASVTLKMRDASWTKRTLWRALMPRREAIALRRRAGRARPIVDRALWALGDVLVFAALRERLGLSRCRVPVTGAAPIAPELITWFHAVGVPLLEGYGQTECGGVSHFNVPGADRVGTVGRVLPGTEHTLAGDGEVLVRGPHVFHGYLHDPEATARTVDADGWLHTGDVGEVDDGGFVRITGRKKEIIITAGGKNLSPEKIENALKLSPWVKEAVAIGDRRKFVSALVQIDRDAVGDWATRQGLTYTSYTDLAAKPEVVALIDGAVRAANELLARVEHVRAFRILPNELHEDAGELTPTQKVRRRVVLELHAGLIETMYGGSREPATDGGAA